MSALKSVCVYCGSRHGIDPDFQTAATAFGRELAAAGLTLVYGGGSIGLMGEVAHACLDAGGTVVGVIPRFLKDREIMLGEVSELVVTADMHERKRIMFERSDAFVAIPGGIGTLEEVVEMMTWAQLGQHRKPVLLANINDFWEPLLTLLAHMEEQAFIGPGWDVNYQVADRIEDIIPTLEAARDLLEAEREPDRAALSRM
jgi:uncharacterized protein (TIGR00730 family)